MIEPDTKITHAFNVILFHFSYKEKVTNCFIRPVKTFVLSTYCSAIACSFEELKYKFLNQRSCILLYFTYCLSVYNLHRSAVFVEKLSPIPLCGDAFCCWFFFFCFFHDVDEKTQTEKNISVPKKG